MRLNVRAGGQGSPPFGVTRTPALALEMSSHALPSLRPSGPDAYLAGQQVRQSRLDVALDAGYSRRWQGPFAPLAPRPMTLPDIEWHSNEACNIAHKTHFTHNSPRPALCRGRGTRRSRIHVKPRETVAPPLPGIPRLVVA